MTQKLKLDQQSDDKSGELKTSPITPITACAVEACFPRGATHFTAGLDARRPQTARRRMIDNWRTIGEIILTSFFDSVLKSQHGFFKSHSCNLTINFHELFSLGLNKQKAVTVRRPPAKLRLSCAVCACRHDCTRVRGGAFARGTPHHPDARRAIFSFFSS